MSVAGYHRFLLPGRHSDRRSADSSREFLGTCLLTAAFCLGFGFFFASNFVFDQHPLAVFPLMELTYGGLIPWSIIIMVVRMQRGTLTTLDVFFFLTPFLLIGLSSAFASINYGQPFILGFAEERRSLGYLLWFLYDPIRRRYQLSTPAVFRALAWCAAIYLVLSLLIQIFASGYLLARKVPDLDPRKLRITSPGDAFALCFLIALVRLATGASRSQIVPALIGLAGLLLVAQTRQTTLMVLLAAAASLFVLQPRLVLGLALVGSVALGGALLAFNIDPITPVVEFIAPNLDEFQGENFASNPRGVTLSITTKLIFDNYFLGLGGVSTMYDGGLTRLYGRHFWIADVGIVGEIFRIGFLWFAFFAVIICLFYNRLLQVRSRSDRVVIVTLGLFYLAQGLSAGFIFRSGGGHSFLFLITMAAAARSAPVTRTVGRLRLLPTASARNTSL